MLVKDVAPKKLLKCPKCDREFLRATGLGSHLRTVHGVIGSAASTVKARMKSEAEVKPEKVEKPEPKNKRHAGGMLECPECHKDYKGIHALANHRRAAHGVKSKSQLRDERRQNALTITQPIPKPERPVANVPQTRTIETDTTAEPDTLVYALAVGQVKELCRHIAEEHGVPAKLFTRQFAELFLRQARG